MMKMPQWDTKIKNKDLLFIEACDRELHIRATDPPYVHWVLDKDADDMEGDFCPDCVAIEFARVKAEQGDVEDDETRTIYEYPESESDGCRHCETCGALLRYTLTDYGMQEELAVFEEAGFDWNNPDDCYHVEAVCDAVYTDEQRRRLVKILKHGRNRPPEMKAQLKRVKAQHTFMPTLKSDLR